MNTMKMKKKISGKFLELLRHEHREAEVIPFCYGIAYRDFARDTTVLMPIPINIIVRGARELYWLMMMLWRNRLEDYVGQKTHEAYREGFEWGAHAANVGQSEKRYRDRRWVILEANKIFSEHFEKETSAEDYQKECERILSTPDWQS